MADDYFSGPVTVVPPTRPAPDAIIAPGGPTGPGRRSRVLALVLGAVLVATAGVAVQRIATAASAVPVSALLAVTAPAPASVGWSPTYVDAVGRPARWDPCLPIHYVVQARWMPVNGRRDLVAALARISAVGGLRFVDDGDTDEVPQEARAAYQPERYGERWAPLLVAWVPPSQTDIGLGDGVQGLALTVAVPGTDAGGHLVTGQVALDADRRLPSGFGPGATDGEVLLHELTHAVGLGHVDDPTQVMFTSTTNSESTFGRGDRAGLVALGRAGGCHPAPAARPLRVG